MILDCHLHFYDEIFRMPRFFSSPVLCFGFQDVETPMVIGGGRHTNLHDAVAAAGLEVHSLDRFDPRADWEHDMNLPVDKSEHDRYGTLIDIGSIEHVFDTRQCMENCMNLVRVGGHWLISTPVHGYFSHGLHTFNPEAILAALELNGFRIVYLRYSNIHGRILPDPCPPPDALIWQDPSVQGDILIWIVAVKERELGTFASPQQGKWKMVYKDTQRRSA